MIDMAKLSSVHNCLKLLKPPTTQHLNINDTYIPKNIFTNPFINLLIHSIKTINDITIVTNYFRSIHIRFYDVLKQILTAERFHIISSS